MNKIEAPKMGYMDALTLSGYRDIWFTTGEYYGAKPFFVANFYRGQWTFYDDPSATGIEYLHFFSHTNGFGISENKMYRFDGPNNWYFWSEAASLKSLKPCDVKSANNIWAVGSPNDSPSPTTIVVRYDGATWREVFRPGGNKHVYDVAMYNQNNGWAVGAEKVGATYYGRIWECRGGVWFERVCPVEEPLLEVEYVSVTEAWAATSYKILHYTTASNVAPASLGRIKARYASGLGGNATGPAAIAAPVLRAPLPGSRAADRSRAAEPPVENAD